MGVGINKAEKAIDKPEEICFGADLKAGVDSLPRYKRCPSNNIGKWRTAGKQVFGKQKMSKVDVWREAHAHSRVKATISVGLRLAEESGDVECSTGGRVTSSTKRMGHREEAESSPLWPHSEMIATTPVTLRSRSALATIPSVGASVTCGRQRWLGSGTEQPWLAPYPRRPVAS